MAKTKTTPVFDKKKPHGVIEGHNQARYEQNGHYFDAAGHYVDLTQSEEQDADKSSD